MPFPGEEQSFNPIASQQVVNAATLSEAGIQAPESPQAATPPTPAPASGGSSLSDGATPYVPTESPTQTPVNPTGGPMANNGIPRMSREGGSRVPPSLPNQTILPPGTEVPIPPQLLAQEGIVPDEPAAPAPLDRTEALYLAQARDKSAADKHRNLKCPECDLVQSATHKVCASCGHDLTDARKAKFANMSQEELVDPKPRVEKAVTLYDDSLSGLKLSDEKKPNDDLIWKAICKSGTLALSPGPGQIDVEKPLELTAELFQELDKSVKERAFPYVTVPLSHANGMLENTGYVRDTMVLPSEDPQDPPGTQVFWGGIEFTEPDIKEKVMRGTIPDTSVGVKFNYRNKRTGKLYPAALEHTALTHQPWVDGLQPFGGQMLSQPYDQETDRTDWLGVMIHADRDEKPSRTTSPVARPARRRAGRRPNPSKPTRPGGILMNQDQSGGMSSTVSDSSAQPRRSRRQAPTAQTQTVEQLMASQQADFEAREAKLRGEIEALQGSVALSQEQSATATAELHLSAVREKAAAWQKDKLPPAFITRAKEILLAAGPAGKMNDEGTLQLSFSKPGDGDDAEPVVETKDLSLAQVVEYLAGGVPKVGDGSDTASVVSAMSELHMSAAPSDEKSAKEKADEMYDEAQAKTSGAGV